MEVSEGIAPFCRGYSRSSIFSRRVVSIDNIVSAMRGRRVVEFYVGQYEVGGDFDFPPLVYA